MMIKYQLRWNRLKTEIKREKRNKKVGNELHQMSVQEYEGINYLVAAAVVNRSFRRLLLRDPSEALAQGYQGVMFVLTDEERAVICEREGRTFAEFLTQIERLNE